MKRQTTAGSGTANDCDTGYGIIADRQKLTRPLDLSNLIKTREAEFEVLNSSKQSFKEKDDKIKKIKKCFENCNLQQITVEPGANENETVLLFADFGNLKNSMHDITPDGGVKKKIDKAGHNGKLPPENAKVWIHYTVICEGYDEIVDQTDRIGKPKAFKLGKGEVLPVLDIGVATMELKEVSKFIATPEYAYGKLGLPNKVPADATVLFTVELVDFLEISAVNTVFKSSDPSVEFKEIEKAAVEMKVEGNKLIKEGKWTSAISKYRKGIKVLDRYLSADQAIDKRRNDILFILYTNLAMCYLNTTEYEKAIECCEQALELPPNTEGNKCKAYYRQANAEYELGRYAEAKNLAKKALKLEPSNIEVRNFYHKTCKKLEEDKKVEKELSKKMCSGLNLNK